MSTDSTGAAAPSRGRNVVLWVCQVLLAVFFVAVAVPKLLGEATAIQMFGLIGFGQWLRYLTGALELLGGIGLLVPRLTGLAALGLAVVMAGATLTQLFIFAAPAQAVLPFVLLIVLLLLAWARREAIPGWS